MSDKKPPRLLADGSTAQDVDVNPKYLVRLEREAEEQARFKAEQAEPWGRSKIERELARLAAQKSTIVINGIEKNHPIDLHGVDLSGQDLSGIDLSYANLHGAKLVGTKLTGARLVNANLHGADLTGAALDGVNAVEANFHGACFCKADVSKTHLMKANLSEVCHEDSSGLDIVENPMTPAEVGQARYRQSEGFRVDISTDDGKIRYFGDTLKGANVTGMSGVHKKRP